MSFGKRTTKQPFKLIEIPLSKFKDQAVPHHRHALETHSKAIKQYILVNGVPHLIREVREKKRTVRQIKDLMYELDTLRAQVEDEDLDKFDTQTLSLRRTLLSFVTCYTNLEKEAQVVIQRHQNDGDVLNENCLVNTPQLQVQESVVEVRLREAEERLQQVENLNQDIQDVHGVFAELNDIVGSQKEQVDMVETNVERASENVSVGLSNLVTASQLSKATYPLSGAVLGMIVGGPIGLMAGFKIGALAAMGCGCAGYFGGRAMKKMAEPDDMLVTSDVGTDPSLNKTEDEANGNKKVI